MHCNDPDRHVYPSRYLHAYVGTAPATVLCTPSNVPKVSTATLGRYLTENPSTESSSVFPSNA